MSGRRRVAVVGAGIAGLAVAHRLAQRHEVTLFERHAEPGFVAHAVRVPGLDARVDVPLRVFYPGYYPTLTRLYGEIGVASEPVSYASTFFEGVGDGEREPYFRYRTLRLGDRSWAWVAPRELLTPRARRIAFDALRFARRAAQAPPGSVAEWVRHEGFSPEFEQGLLLPAICTICTCSVEAARAMPAAVVAQYLRQGVTRQSVRRALHGADDVAERLLRGPITLRTGHAVSGVQVSEGAVVLRTAGEVLRFDHLVLATQANQALALLAAPSAAERAALAGFAYQRLRVLMHRDAGLLPGARRDWSAVNLRVQPGSAAPESTIWMNAVMPALRRAPDLFQTVLPDPDSSTEPRADLVLSDARFERPLVNARSVQALAALQALHAQPGRRLWFCGSYAEEGVPLLESAVRSALAVAEKIA